MGDAADFTAMLAEVTAGNIEPVVDRVLPLDEGRAALERLEDAKQFGKIVLDIG
jgi:NADPH:quinone reductase-like Zn-dependent oxidoreductase